MQQAQLGYIILYVPNVNGTIKFYQKAFGLEVKFIHESQKYAEMETGQTALAFADEKFAEQSHSFMLNRKEQKSPGMEIAFVVEHVHEAYQHALDHGCSSVHPPEKKPWGQTVAYVQDLNGILVELCDRI